jgi:serine protease Do
VWPIAVAIIAMGGLAAIGWNIFSGSRVHAADPRTAGIAAPAGAVEMQNAFQSVAEHVHPAVVSITSRMTIKPPQVGAELGQSPFGDLFGEGQEGPMFPGPRAAIGEGSGFIVRPDGYILTNDHVVGGADSVTVRLDDGREFPGKVTRDQRSDLAIVKVDASGLPTLALSDSKPAVGQWAIAYGSPFGLEDTMTVGVVSALGRETAIAESREEGRFYPNLIQTDASINPGNSGGPLLDINGTVIGVNVAISSPTGTSVGIGFAIPASTARYIMDELITKGAVTRGFLGFAPESITGVEKSRYGVDHGALVTMVQDNSPAATAGLQVEDVVTSFNGQDVQDSAQLRDLVSRTAPGQTVKIVVRRDGKDMTLNATVQPAPSQKTAAAATPQPGQGKLGVQIAQLTPEIAKELGLKPDAKGVVVATVSPGSPAAEAGLRPGDVLVRINGKTVDASSDVTGALSSLKPGDEASLVVRRGDARVLLRATLR